MLCPSEDDQSTAPPTFTSPFGSLISPRQPNGLVNVGGAVDWPSSLGQSIGGSEDDQSTAPPTFTSPFGSLISPRQPSGLPELRLSVTCWPNTPYLFCWMWLPLPSVTVAMLPAASGVKY